MKTDPLHIISLGAGVQSSTMALMAAAGETQEMSTNELQARLLYSVIVAGKSADFAEKALGRFNMHSRGSSPFEMIRRLVAEDYLKRALELARTGNYAKTAKCFRALAEANLDLKTCTPQHLEAIHGIGPKTSRFWIMWTRPESETRYAALDTHVLKWLRYLGHDAPKATPTGRKYADLEQTFLAECDKRGMTARAIDAMIWDFCSTGGHLKGDWPDALSASTSLKPKQP